MTRRPRSIEEAKREELARVGLEVAAQELMATMPAHFDLRNDPFTKALFYGIAAMIRRETLGQ